MPIFRLNKYQQKLLDSKAPNVVFAGGWGNGKTTAGVLACLEHALEYKKEAIILMLRQTYQELQDTLMKEFDAIIPKGLIARKRDSPPPFRQFTNGATVLFRYMGDSSNREAQLEHLSSINATCIIIDQAEEITERAYLTAQGRLRGGKKDQLRQCILLCNMKGHNFIWRDFKFNPVPGNELIEAPTSANWQNLPVDYRQRLERLSPKWRRVYLEGDWDAFAGSVWDVEEKHLLGALDPDEREPLPYEAIPDAHGLYRGMDFGVNAPTAMLYGAWLPGNILVVYKEVYKIGLLVDFKQAVADETTNDEEEALYVTFLDPKCWSDYQQAPSWGKTPIVKAKRWSIKDDLIAHPNGIAVQKANNAREYGINKVAELLVVDPRLVNPFTNGQGSPRLFIHRSCVNLLHEISMYEFAEGKTFEDIPLETMSRTADTHDHACDALRYLVATGPWRLYAEPLQTREGVKNVRQRYAKELTRNFMGA